MTDELHEKIAQASALAQSIKTEIKKVLIGQDDIIEQVLVALIGQGHVLLEGVPGLGKTLLVQIGRAHV